MTRFPVLALCASLSVPPAAAADWAEASAIFDQHCVHCHEGDDAPLGLSLASHAGVTAGSMYGQVVRPDSPEDSPLYGRITGAIEPRMPLDGPPFLEDAQIALLLDWIAAGAPGPERDEPEAVAAPAPDPYEDGTITFPEVEKIFLTRCIECHSDNSKLGAPPEDLRLSSYPEILAGGDRIAVISGNPLASEIMRRIMGLADPRMPLDGPPWLEDDQIALLADWIEGGARDADGNPASVPVGTEVRYRGTMTGPQEIDGVPFTVTGSTRIDDRPGIGQRAEVRGRVAEDGSIVATRWRDR